MLINVEDSETPNDNTNLAHYFDQTNNFIEEKLKYGNILVFCNKGKSRSTFINAVFLMKKLNESAN